MLTATEQYKLLMRWLIIAPTEYHMRDAQLDDARVRVAMNTPQTRASWWEDCEEDNERRSSYEAARWRVAGNELADYQRENER